MGLSLFQPWSTVSGSWKWLLVDSSKLPLRNLFFRNLVARLIPMVAIHSCQLFSLVKFFKKNFVSCFIYTHCFLYAIKLDGKCLQWQKIPMMTREKLLWTVNCFLAIYKVFLRYLKNELTKSLPVNAWNPINNSMISFFSSMSLNLYDCLLLFSWKLSKISLSLYWCGRPIINITISVSPEDERI